MFPGMPQDLSLHVPMAGEYLDRLESAAEADVVSQADLRSRYICFLCSNKLTYIYISIYIHSLYKLNN